VPASVRSPRRWGPIEYEIIMTHPAAQAARLNPPNLSPDRAAVPIILDVEWVPTPGGEARSALECFTRLAPQLKGAQGVIYDTALHGVHHQHLLRDLGWLTINRVTAARAGAAKPRRNDGGRVEKNVHIEDKTITLPDGTDTTIRLFARAGALGIAEPTNTGKPSFVPLTRIRTHRNADKNGRYRWYNDYQLPARNHA
jgi:hypothetical protein